VLEVGTGSGYQTAVLSRLVERVFSVERVASLLRFAQTRLDDLGIRNVALRHGDGSMGWQEFSPYARVLVSAAAPRGPEALRAQLDEGGVLVIPVGGAQFQHLEVWHRLAADRWQHERRGECRFVPLLGREAWREDPDGSTERG
jgi:protein-L-isoaspartate(D-aspartate) O-methyltransferase